MIHEHFHDSICHFLPPTCAIERIPGKTRLSVLVKICYGSPESAILVAVCVIRYQPTTLLESILPLDVGEADRGQFRARRDKTFITAGIGRDSPYAVVTPSMKTSLD